MIEAARLQSPAEQTDFPDTAVRDGPDTRDRQLRKASRNFFA